MIYLAYGSNMHIGHMKHRCPTGKLLGTSTLMGYRLVFNNVATVVPDPDRCVPVVLWNIQPADEKNLDRYEGYPRLYRKETVQVELNGETVDAMVYIMNSDGVRAPGRFYYDVISEGYEANGLDTAPLEQALQESLTAG